MTTVTHILLTYLCETVTFNAGKVWFG